MLVIDIVTGLTIAFEHALDRDFGVTRPLPYRLAQAVVKDQLNTGPRHRFTVKRAIKNHVLHRLSAQRGSLGFAQHPAQRVDNIRLAATIGTDDAHYLPRQGDMGGINERLETGEINMG